jgi:hypothetical protein
MSPARAMQTVSALQGFIIMRQHSQGLRPGLDCCAPSALTYFSESHSVVKLAKVKEHEELLLKERAPERAPL